LRRRVLADLIAEVEVTEQLRPESEDVGDLPFHSDPQWESDTHWSRCWLRRESCPGRSRPACTDLRFSDRTSTSARTARSTRSSDSPHPARPGSGRAILPALHSPTARARARLTSMGRTASHRRALAPRRRRPDIGCPVRRCRRPHCHSRCRGRARWGAVRSRGAWGSAGAERAPAAVGVQLLTADRRGTAEAKARRMQVER
jgi:hypothetical protein